MRESSTRTEVVNSRTYEAVTHGFVAWLVQRVSAVILLLLLPLKIWSGWAFTGRAPGGSLIVSLHTNAWLDVLLLTALAFHALYGIRTILVESGMARHSRQLFVLATATAAVLALAAIAVTVTGRM